MKKLFLLLITSHILFGITLVPMTETLETKKKKNIVFKVSNPTSEPVAVDFSIMKVTDTTNKELREETSLVQAYPTQFVLSPKETKSVRVRYMSNELPAKEEVYRVIAKELDIEVTDKKEENIKGKVGVNIKMRFSYEGLLFIHQKDAKSSIKIEHIQKDNRGIQLTLANSGNVSDLPSNINYDYFVTIQGQEYQLQKEDFKNTSFRRVLAGKSKILSLQNITTLPIEKIESMRVEKK